MSFDYMIPLMVEYFISTGPLSGRHEMLEKKPRDEVEAASGLAIKTMRNWFNDPQYSTCGRATLDMLDAFSSVYNEYLEKKGIRYPLKNISIDDIKEARSIFIAVVDYNLRSTKEGQELYRCIVNDVDRIILNWIEGRKDSDPCSEADLQRHRSDPDYETISYKEAASTLALLVVVVASDKRYGTLRGHLIMRLIPAMLTKPQTIGAIVSHIYAASLLD